MRWKGYLNKTIVFYDNIKSEPLKSVNLLWWLCLLLLLVASRDLWLLIIDVTFANDDDDDDGGIVVDLWRLQLDLRYVYNWINS